MSLIGANDIFLFRGTPYSDNGIDLTRDGGYVLLEMLEMANTNTSSSATYHIYVTRRLKDNLLQNHTRIITVLNRPSFPSTSLIILQGDGFDNSQDHGLYFDRRDNASGVGSSSSNVNYTELGNYTLTKTVVIYTRPYSTNHGYNYVTLSRNVTVIKKPLIVMNGSNISIEQYAPYIDQGASVRNYNNTNEVLTNTLSTSNNINMQIPGTYYVTYSTTNTPNLTRTVTVTPFARIPIINLIGDSTYVIITGDIFNEPGFNVDVIDSATVGITTILNRTTLNTYSAFSAGLYTINYNYTTSYGKSASTVQRTIIVVDLPVINLTGNTSIPFGLSNDDPGYELGSLSTLLSSTTINTLILGPQTITYTVKLTAHPHITNTASRTITIVDVTAPIITLIDPISARLGSNIQTYEKNVTLSANGTVKALSSISNNKTCIYKYEAGEWENVYEISFVSGNSISLNSDGTVLAVLSVLNGENDIIKIYKNSGGIWGPMVQFDKTGSCVSLSADGTIIAVGGDNITNIYKYIEDINTWDNKIGQDIFGEAIDDKSGYSVSINAAGNILAIGSILNDGVNKNNCGNTRVYMYNTTSFLWVQLGHDIDGELNGDESGFSVSLSLSGYTLAIGSVLNDNNTFFDSGSTRVFSYNGLEWYRVGQDIDGERSGEKSGYVVSLSANGHILAVANSDENFPTTRIYAYNGSQWVKLCQDISNEGDTTPSISLSCDGCIIAIGSNIYKLINNKYLDWQIGNYIEAGAISNEGSAVSISTFLSDNIQTLGEYTVNYTSTDEAKNTGYNSRKVTVIEIPSINFVKNYNYMATDIDLILPLAGRNSTISYVSAPAYTKSITGDYSVTFTATSNNIFSDFSIPVFNKINLGDYKLSFNPRNNINTKIKTVLIKNITIAAPPTLTLLGDNPHALTIGTEYVEAGWLNTNETNVIGTAKLLYEVQGSYDIIYKVSFNNPTVDSYFKRVVNVKKEISNDEKISKSNDLANIAALHQTELILAQRLTESKLTLYNVAKQNVYSSTLKILTLNTLKSLFDEYNIYITKILYYKSSIIDYITALEYEITKSINIDLVNIKIVSLNIELSQLILTLANAENTVNNYNIELINNAVTKESNVNEFISTYNLIKSEYEGVVLSLAENTAFINECITNRNNFREKSLSYQTAINDYYNTSNISINIEALNSLNLIITEYELPVSTVDVSPLLNYHQKVLAYKNATDEYHKILNIALLAGQDASYTESVLAATESKINEISIIKNSLVEIEAEALNIYSTAKNNKDNELNELSINLEIVKLIYNEKWALLNNYVKYLENDLITIIINNKLDHVNRLKSYYIKIIGYISNMRLLNEVDSVNKIIELKEECLEKKDFLNIVYIDYIASAKKLEKDQSLEISRANFEIFRTFPLLLDELNLKLNEYNNFKTSITIAYDFLKVQITQKASSNILVENIANLFKLSKIASNDSIAILNLIKKAEDEAKENLKATQYKLLVSTSQNLTEIIIDDTIKINEANDYLSNILSIKFQLRDISTTQIALENVYLQEFTELYEALKVENTQNINAINQLLDEAKINKTNAENAFNEVDHVLKFTTNTKLYLQNLKYLYNLIKEYKTKVTAQTATPEDDANHVINLASVRTLKITRSNDVIFYTTPRLLTLIQSQNPDFEALKSNITNKVTSIEANITNKVTFIEENKTNLSLVLKNAINDLYNLADTAVDEAKSILESLTEYKTESANYSLATQSKVNISNAYNLSEEIKTADDIKNTEATAHSTIIDNLQIQLANIYIDQENLQNSYFNSYNSIYISINSPNSIFGNNAINTAKEIPKYKNSLFSIRSSLYSITATNETLIDDINELDALNTTISSLGNQLEAELKLEVDLSSEIQTSFLPALTAAEEDFKTINQTNFELLETQEDLIASGDAINTSTIEITNSIIVANKLLEEAKIAEEQANAEASAAAVVAAAEAAEAAEAAAAATIAAGITNVNNQANDYYDEVITYFNTSQTNLVNATASLNISDIAYKSSIINTTEAGIKAVNAQSYSTITANISSEALIIANDTPTPINIKGSEDITILSNSANNAYLEAYKASNTTLFLSSTIAKNAFDNTKNAYDKVNDSNDKIFVYKDSIFSDLSTLLESNDITYKITILDTIYDTINLAKIESLMSNIAANNATYASDIAVIADENSKDFYEKARDYSITANNAKKSAEYIILRMGSTISYTESQNYFAASVEEINIGRNPVTTISDYTPTNIYQIVWKMNLNDALNGVNIKPPYQVDSEEQEHKKGILQNGFIYLLGTDSYTKEIEIVSSEVNYGGFLSYTDNIFNKTISSDSNTGSLEDRLADLARYLRVLGDESIDILNSSLPLYISSITKKIISATYTYTADSLKVGDGVLEHSQGYSSEAQDLAISTFMSNLKANNFWYASDSNNNRPIQNIVKVGLCNLFDKDMSLNDLLGSNATSSVFIDSDKIVLKMKNSNDDFYKKFFSEQQLREVLSSVNAKNSRIKYTNDVKSFDFISGDSISAVLRIVDGDTKDSNSDRWLITLLH